MLYPVLRMPLGPVTLKEVFLSCYVTRDGFSLPLTLTYIFLTNRDYPLTPGLEYLNSISILSSDSYDGRNYPISCVSIASVYASLSG